MQKIKILTRISKNKRAPNEEKLLFYLNDQYYRMNIICNMFYKSL